MNDYLTNATRDHTHCSRDRCLHLLAATGSDAELRHVLVEQSLRRSLSVKVVIHVRETRTSDSDEIIRIVRVSQNRT